ncbi:hypothetical protein GCM10027613_31120 [Microlunatus endophyticus]
MQAGETIGACVARNLASKVDLAEIAHLEQLETRSEPDRDPFQRTIATAYLGLVPSTAKPQLPPNAAWIRTEELPTMAFDHASLVRSAMERLERKLSYSNIGFGLAPAEFTLAQLRDIYRAALGYDVSATNLQRVLKRRGQLEPTGRTAAAGGVADVRRPSTVSPGRACRSPTRSPPSDRSIPTRLVRPSMETEPAVRGGR